MLVNYSAVQVGCVMWFTKNECGLWLYKWRQYLQQGSDDLALLLIQQSMLGVMCLDWSPNSKRETDGQNKGRTIKVVRHPKQPMTTNP